MFADIRQAQALEMRQFVGAKGDDRKTHYDKAVAQIDQGLKKVSGAKAMELMFFKAELQIPAQDVTGARQTIRELSERRNLRPEVLDYFKARILLAEGKWHEAAEALNRIRSQMADFGRDRAMEVDYSLGLCYERLGQFDLAKEKYETVLQQDPQNEPAKAGFARVNNARGVEPSERGGGDQLQELVAAELKKPKDQRNWAAIYQMWEEKAKERQLDSTTIQLGKAQMMMMHEDFDGAAKALTEAKNLSPKNLLVQRTIIQLARLNPKVGPAKALEVWNRSR